MTRCTCAHSLGDPPRHCLCTIANIMRKNAQLDWLGEGRRRGTWTNKEIEIINIYVIKQWPEKSIQSSTLRANYKAWWCMSLRGKTMCAWHGACMSVHCDTRPEKPSARYIISHWAIKWSWCASELALVVRDDTVYIDDRVELSASLFSPNVSFRHCFVVCLRETGSATHTR